MLERPTDPHPVAVPRHRHLEFIAERAAPAGRETPRAAARGTGPRQRHRPALITSLRLGHTKRRSECRAGDPAGIGRCAAERSAVPTSAPDPRPAGNRDQRGRRRVAACAPVRDGRPRTRRQARAVSARRRGATTVLGGELQRRTGISAVRMGEMFGLPGRTEVAERRIVLHRAAGSATVKAPRAHQDEPPVDRTFLGSGPVGVLPGAAPGGDAEIRPGSQRLCGQHLLHVSGRDRQSGPAPTARKNVQDTRSTPGQTDAMASIQIEFDVEADSSPVWQVIGDWADGPCGWRRASWRPAMRTATFAS